MILMDGENWETIYTIPNQPAFEMNYIKDFTGNTNARYVRYQVPEGAPNNAYNNDNVYCCNIAEIELYGEFVSAISAEGDINSDDELTIAVVVMLQNYIVHRGDVADWQSGDLCEDGRLDVFDLIAMKNKLISR